MLTLISVCVIYCNEHKKKELFFMIFITILSCPKMYLLRTTLKIQKKFNYDVFHVCHNILFEIQNGTRVGLYK